jgi:hypothetical protein
VAIWATKGNAVQLDMQTRLNITRWAEEYIAGLVENHNGDSEDVRSIIHDLGTERPYRPRQLPVRRGAGRQRRGQQ